MSIKIESSEIKPQILSCKIDKKISMKLESEENCSKLSEFLLKIFKFCHQSKIQDKKSNKNVKTDAEKELLVILPQKKLINFQFQLKLRTPGSFHDIQWMTTVKLTVIF